ncbi:MAG: hypothetical protein GEV07_14785 [Streptosporangiales bacterium]|nr:hypothetical protein [Streptosporangiales bacterium]
MPNRLRTTLLASLTAVALTATGCSFVTGSEETSADGSCGTQTLRLATIRAESDPATLAAKRFAKLVDNETDGKITVKVFANSQLGSFEDIFAAMKSGEGADMFYEGISIYPTLKGAEAFLVSSVPFIWDDYDQMIRVLGSPKFTKLREQAAKKTGVRVIAINGDAEPRALSANKAIRNTDDMKGLKLRIAEAPMPKAFAEVVGAKPQAIELSDLYVSLRQGVVDAQENGAITMVNQSLHEVQDYYMPTDYIRDARSWYAGEELWQSLCDSQRKALVKAGNKAGAYNTAQVDKQMDEAMKTLKQEVTVVQPDIAAFRAAVDGEFDKFDGKSWPKGLLAEVERLKKQTD